MTEKKNKKSVSRRQYSIDIQKNKIKDIFQKSLDNISFEKEFGINSRYFIEFKQEFTNLNNLTSVNTKLDVNQNIEKWKSFFSEIYHDEDIGFELYRKHAYLLLISNISLEIINDNILSFFQNPDEIGNIFNFEEKFKVNNFLSALFSEIYFLEDEFYSYLQIKDSKYSWLVDLKHQIYENLQKYFDPTNADDVHSGDLFNLLYQELIIPGRRHKLGEFYTPIPLAKLMVDYTYALGNFSLDPACGTGTFLIEIMKKILDLANKEEKLNLRDIFKNLTQIFGVEINPVTSIVTRLNILQYILTDILSKSHIKQPLSIDILSDLQKISQNIITSDFLIPNERLKTNESLIHIENQKYDLIIGNPPWLVINGVHSIDYKEHLKNFAKSMNIGTTTQNVSNLELSSLFLAKSTNRFLKDNGKLFFVTSAGLLTGTQNDRIREFHGLKNLKIWKFDKDLFNIHNICVYAEMGIQDPEKKYHIEVETKVCSDNPISIRNGKKEIYMPIYKKVNNNSISSNTLNSYFQNSNEIGSKIEYKVNLIGRFVSESEYKNFFANKKHFSTYRDRFRQGACIGPRNLLFCENLSFIKDKNCKKILDETPELFFLKEELSQNFDIDGNKQNKKINKNKSLSDFYNDNNTIIRPDLSILYKKYSQWDFKAYDYGLIESKYLHEAAKSSDLIPFFLLTTRTFFLPIRLFSDVNWSKLYDESKKKKIQFMPNFGFNEYSKNHYEKLTQIYAQNVKSGNFAKDLFLNINHNNKLLNENQKADFKLVYNGIGSIVKAAIINGDIVIDSSLYYTVPQSKDEAYYLMGVLNAPIITELVTLMGSTGANGSLRNIHKNPLENNFPEFSGTNLQREIIKKAKEMESFVIDMVVEFLLNKLKKFDKMMKICNKCGSIFKENRYISHIKSCKAESDYSLLKIALESLTDTDLESIKQIEIIKKIIINSKFIETERINLELWDKLLLIIKYILKPKTIQIKLQKNKKFNILHEELNQLVKKLILK